MSLIPSSQFGRFNWPCLTMHDAPCPSTAVLSMITRPPQCDRYAMMIGCLSPRPIPSLSPSGRLFPVPWLRTVPAPWPVGPPVVRPRSSRAMEPNTPSIHDTHGSRTLFVHGRVPLTHLSYHHHALYTTHLFHTVRSCGCPAPVMMLCHRGRKLRREQAVHHACPSTMPLLAVFYVCLFWLNERVRKRKMNNTMTTVS